MSALSPNSRNVRLRESTPRGTIPSSAGNYAGPLADPLPPAAAPQQNRKLLVTNLGRVANTGLLRLSGSFLWAIVPDGLTLKLIFDPPDAGVDQSQAIRFIDGDSLGGIYFTTVYAIVALTGVVAPTDDVSIVTMRPDQ
jgi:hypothetical protein